MGVSGPSLPCHCLGFSVVFKRPKLAGVARSMPRHVALCTEGAHITRPSNHQPSPTAIL